MSQAISKPAADLISDPAVSRPRRLSSEEYMRLAELGYFEGQHVELIEGQILLMSPQGPPHVYSIAQAHGCLAEVFGEIGFVVDQSTYAADDFSYPEPDLAVIRGQPRDYAKRHATPQDTLLLVEVSQTTQKYDRGTKMPLYAKVGITEFWILDLKARQLEVYRDPQTTDEGEGRYATLITLKPDQTISPLEKPDVTIKVQDLMV
ncbi:MAG: Uma2 family endonuclease [Planctomycetota bacterium]